VVAAVDAVARGVWVVAAWAGAGVVRVVDAGRVCVAGAVDALVAALAFGAGAVLVVRAGVDAALRVGAGALAARTGAFGAGARAAAFGAGALGAGALVWVALAVGAFLAGALVAGRSFSPKGTMRKGGAEDCASAVAPPIIMKQAAPMARTECFIWTLLPIFVSARHSPWR
jgi:hypothetical protein